jgi:hypothetical protein
VVPPQIDPDRFALKKFLALAGARAERPRFIDGHSTQIAATA